MAELKVVAWFNPANPNAVINAAQYPHVLPKNKVGYLPCIVAVEVPSYRLLNEHDTIEATDEFLHDDCVRWLPPCGWEIGRKWNNGFVPARRCTPGAKSNA